MSIGSFTGNETGDGQMIDMWTIKKPNVLQTNFYGASVYFDEMTIFEDQIETVMFPYNIVENQGEKLIALCK